MTYDGMGDKELDQTLSDLRRSYNVPPERVPADEMWGRIESARWGGRRAVGRARAFWWIGMAGIDGIQNKIHPGEAATKDLYHLPPEEDKPAPVTRTYTRRVN